MKEEDQDILFYAFRYALGRRSAAVSQVVGIINNRWGDIPRRNKEQMQAEIRHAVRMGRAGDKCDIKDWQKILNLKIKSGKDIDVPTRSRKEDISTILGNYIMCVPEEVNGELRSCSVSYNQAATELNNYFRSQLDSAREEERQRIKYDLISSRRLDLSTGQVVILSDIIAQKE